MKFILADLKEGSRFAVEGSYDSQTLDVEFHDMRYQSPIRLTGHVEKSAGTLRFQGVLSASLVRLCGKCLKENYEKLEREFDWFFETENKEIIEPVENVRELLIFEHPLVALCKPDCRGLCPQCGINRNEGTCNCKENSYHATPVIIRKKNSTKEKHHGTS